ncbi:hypothetical protein [Microbacterium sp. Root180]|uniref:hypothetical protein n=1 Tax=Microbacterium sp. Root180 TaxID=1736483 RepID=UPI0006F80F52|nr:hypothetical protein [Microbacterium sp. Root180]KRB36658.1 hypothetical protein ASD93_11450 [Microbacterium sp. Root180]
MPRPAPLPEELSRSGFRSSTARQLGVSPGRLSRSDLHKPFHGVRVPSTSLARLGETDIRGAEDYWERLHAVALARVDAALLLVGPRTVLSHITAARLLELPLPVRLQRDVAVHVSVARREERPQIVGIRSHLAPRDVTSAIELDGRRMTSAVQTWCALAPLVLLDELVTVGDDLVRRIDPHSTMAELDDAVSRSAGRHGAKRLRAALELVRPRTDSPKETELRLLLADAALPEPIVNHPLFDVRGHFIRHGDLAYPRHLVLVEYNGEQHRTDDAQFRLDTEQLDRIVAAGWLVVQVVKDQMRHPAGVAQRVRSALVSRGWRP